MKKKLDYDQIKTWCSIDYDYNKITRERAAADLSFFWITHWDDAILSGNQLLYRGEFDLLRKAMRDIMSDMRASPVQADFEPLDGTSDEDADIMDGIYRSSCRKNSSAEAFDNASVEQVVAGLGGWRLYTMYESDSMGNNHQVICREPIYEFNNTVFFDSNARMIDKSDANRCLILVPMSRRGYAQYYEELTGEEVENEDKIVSTFMYPENGWTFPWALAGGGVDVVYIGEFYHRHKKKVKIHFFRDILGAEQAYEQEEDDTEEEMIAEFKAGGYEHAGSKQIERYVVDKYILDGNGILKGPDRIVGEHIPVIPQFGERAYIQGNEHYEGIVKAAKDPQLLRDFAMSYMADIVSRSPRIQPIYAPEQIQGFEHMYEANGSDSQYPFLMQNMYDAAGNQLPFGPLGTTPEQPIPTGLTQLMQEMRMAVEDVANPGIPNNISDPDLSGKALNTLVAQFDQQSFVYQDHRKYSIRRDAEVFASMAREVYDAPRNVVMTMPDNSRKEMAIMQPTLDIDSGSIKTLRDLSRARFEVYADIGRNYTSSKEAARDKLEQLLPNIAATDPALAKATIMKIVGLTDGDMMKDFRDYARQQLILMGVSKPETDEEKAMLQQAQEAQSQQQDPNMALAMAEQMKAQNGAIKNQIDQYRAETDRMAVMVDADKANAEIDYKKVQSKSLAVNDAVKIRQSVRMQ